MMVPVGRPGVGLSALGAYLLHDAATAGCIVIGAPAIAT